MRFQGAVLVWTLVELLMAMSIIGNLVGLWLSRGPARDAPRRMPASQQRRPVLCTLLASVSCCWLKRLPLHIFLGLCEARTTKRKCSLVKV